MQVRAIFEKYLKAGSLMALCNWLNQQGWRNKAFTTARGLARGGNPFDKSTLHKMLSNVLYRGQIAHGAHTYPGEHQAIIDEDLFGRVQGMLARNRQSGGKYQRNKYGALLKGLVRCKHCGCAMVHHYAAKGAKRYRYYVCLTAQKKGWASCPYPSLPAGELEQFVIDQIKAACSDTKLLADVVQQATEQVRQQIDEVKQMRVRQEIRVRRINDHICQLARVPHVPGAGRGERGEAGAELAMLQEELRKAEAALAETNRQILALEDRLVDEDELIGAFEAFEPMWDRMRPDERARLVHLLVQCVEYDGQAGEIALSYHSGGLAAMRDVELTHA